MSIVNNYRYDIEILEYQKRVKEEVPKRKVNTRGVLKVDGYTEFNPNLNVKLTKSKAA